MILYLNISSVYFAYFHDMLFDFVMSLELASADREAFRTVLATSVQIKRHNFILRKKMNTLSVTTLQ